MLWVIFNVICLVGTAVQVIMWIRDQRQPSTKELSPVERIALDCMNKVIGGRGVFISREELAKEMGCGDFEAYDVMDSMKKKGYLEKSGWKFTIGAAGYAVLSSRTNVADQCSSKPATTGM